jgi:geranylgeranyl reductase family protein
VDERREVLVVGGGPAGSAAAILFARAGHDVLLVDAARFPRDKVCGESVSPGAWPALDALELADDVRALAPQPIHGMALTSPGGVSFRGEYRDAARPGFALRRLDFDDALLRAATRAGVEARQSTRAVELLCDAGSVTGVVTEDEAGARTHVRARLVIAADGRRSLVARRLGLLREHPRLRKYAVRGHWDGMQGLGPWGELHVTRGAYCGVAPLGPRRGNVAFVVDRRDMAAAAGDVEGFYRRTLALWPRLVERLGGAILLEPPRAVGPLALEARSVWAPGAMLTGDAAGFFDPFTGEGITLALRSAQWAAEVGTRALRSPAGPLDLRAYAGLRHAATRDKFRLNRLLYEVLRRPAAADWLAAHLARRPRAADRLVGIVGDFVPTREAFGLGLVAELLRA